MGPTVHDEFCRHPRETVETIYGLCANCQRQRDRGTWRNNGNNVGNVTTGSNNTNDDPFARPASFTSNWVPPMASSSSDSGAGFKRKYFESDGTESSKKPKTEPSN
ncbi:hypothetical protein SBRCBS47491_006981 [Sporothrix bragantina]|uniref:Uncharacterized protein n=1 Tax=Sporothrix bragantina TaxID=671064 RepID=A0ABP0C9T1_9PEZI